MTTLKNVAIIANTMNGIGINAKSFIAKWTLVPVVHATKNEAKRNSTIWSNCTPKTQHKTPRKTEMRFKALFKRF